MSTGEQPPTVEVVYSGYQPSKAELEADISIDKTPDEVAKACLLYTSPSPRDSCASRMPSSA